MDWLIILIVAAVTFGICYLCDLAFKKLFRNQKEHESGKSVRMDGKSAAFGLISGVVGIAAIITGLDQGWFLCAGGALLILIGAALVVRYLTFGIFYSDERFVLTSFGKGSGTYYFKDICAQQLYNNHGYTIIELHMSDGRSVLLQQSMRGVYPFLDHAFACWLRQTGRTEEMCSFYDPANSCWFPPLEVK